MITDPRSTPDSRLGRLLFAVSVASLAAWFIIGPNQRGAPLMALAALAVLTPLIDRLMPARRFEWPRGAPPADPGLRQPAITPVWMNPWGTKETRSHET